MATGESQQNDFVDKYRAQGLNVIPCKPNDKKPSVAWKNYQTKKYEQTIPRDANVGIICGKSSGSLLVVDIDNANSDFIDKIYDDALNKTLVVKTGSGGYHIYFRVEKLPNTGRLNNDDGVHVDIQSEGTYVIAPPSVHPNGNVYEKISSTDNIKKIDFEEIIKNLEKLGFTPHSKLSIPEISKGNVSEGNRNDSAFKYSCFLLGTKGLDEKTSWWEIQKWNNSNNPPLPERELRTTFESACKTVQNSSAGIDADNDEKKKHTKYADKIMQDFRFKTLMDTEEVLVYKEGVYRHGAEVLIKEECEKRIKNCTGYMANEVIKTIQRTTYCRREDFDTDPYLINVKNGLLEIRTGKFSNHDPKIPCRVQIPVNYNQKAGPENYMKFLIQCLPEQKDRETVNEEFASTLLPQIKLEKISMYAGGGANGKSTFLEIIATFLGKENISNIPIHDLIFHRFAKAELDGKSANIYSDIESNELTKLGVLKALVSGDPVNAEKKGKNPFSLRNFAKFFYSANQLPEIGEDTDAVFRRFMITEWTQKFQFNVSEEDKKHGIHEMNPIILQTLTTQDELSGILNLLIIKTRKLLLQGRFTYDQSTAQLRTEWRDKADPITSFISNCLIMDVQAIVPKATVYRVYVKWCIINKFIPKSEKGFNSKLKEKISIEAGVRKINGKATRVWAGIKLNLEEDVVRQAIKELPTSVEDPSQEKIS